MHLRDLFRAKKPVVSFEIFPPKPGTPVEGIYATLEAIRDLNPDFVSVTYGAGGSTKNLTREIASTVKNRFGLEVMAHFTGLSHSPAEVDDMAEDLMEEGICNVLAMRGDPPQDGVMPPNPAFPHAADLIRHLRRGFGDDLTIAAAAYPEGHLECPDPEQDLLHLKAKVDEGVDFLVTQLFFDNELFFRFAERIRALGITVPLCAGVFPVLNPKQVQRILSLCGVAFPPRFARILGRYADDPAALAEAGIAYATDQIIDLLSWGVEGIHLYTLNRPETTRRIMDNIGLVRRSLVDRNGSEGV